MSETKSDLIREDIRRIVKEAYPNPIRQKDLIAKLETISNQYTSGAIRGVLNKMDGVGGIYIPVPNVTSFKKENKAFYEYSESRLDGLKKKVEQFDLELQEQGYLNLNITELESEELKKYLKFIDVIKELRKVF